MSKYKVKMVGGDVQMDKITLEDELKLGKQPKEVKINLSKNMLNRMKIKAGLKGQVSDNTILHAYIMTTIKML